MHGMWKGVAPRVGPRPPPPNPAPPTPTDGFHPGLTMMKVIGLRQHVGVA